MENRELTHNYIEKITKPLLVIKKNITHSSTIKDIVKNYCPFTWEEVFKNAEPELDDISDILMNDEKINGPFFPLKENIFRAFELTQLNNIKVVIIGQDPYHDTIYNGLPRAIGLAFSVSKDANIPPSLKNIYKELERSIPEFKQPLHGDLSCWTNQGILLLNMCLTVRPHRAGSHGSLWLGFINKVINAICEKNEKCIFLMWGLQAQKIRTMLGDRAIILTANHPSGFSANRGSEPFIGCNHFVKINEILKKIGKSEIDWNIY